MPILKRTLFTTCICLFALTSWCQTEIDTSFRYQMNTIFANVDKSKVPFGLLRDYGMEFAKLEVFNGNAALVDSNSIFPPGFWAIYNTLTSARVNTASNFLKRADSLDLQWYNSLKADTIVLTGLFVQYSRFKDNASPNFITISGNQLFDKYVSGVWQNPYQTEKLFAICPPKMVFSDTLSLTLLLQINLWQTNATYNNLSIDANDGLGYRSLTPGAILSITYSTAGLKEWKYRIDLGSSIYLYAHSWVSVGRPPGIY